MIETSSDAVTDKIELYEKESEKIRNLRNNAVTNIEECIEKRDKSNKEFQKRKALIQKIKEKRDALNEKVQECKKKRDENRDIIKKKREEIETLNYELDKYKNRFPGIYGKTKEEIDKLEWRIQTETLQPDDERNLVSKIASLEARLGIQKRRSDILNKIKQLKKEVEKLKSQATRHHINLENFATESEDCHKQMIELVNEATTYKMQADKAHQSFLEAKKKANELQQQMILLTTQIRGINKAMRESAKKEQFEKGEEIKKKIETSANSKLKKGERLSFDEFKILIEKGSI